MPARHFFLGVSFAAVAALGCNNSQDLGVSGDGSQNPGPSEPGPASPAGLRAFVTASKFSGKLVDAAGSTSGGLAAADEICQNAAKGAGLSGTFYAYLASRDVGAQDRLLDEGPFFGVDGKTQVYANKAAVGSGAATDIRDERGQPAYDIVVGVDKWGDYHGGAVAATFWTGATPIGKPAAADCSAWTGWQDSLTTAGAFGSYLGSKTSDVGPCDAERHLLCLEQSQPVATPVTKRVFVTSSAYSGAFGSLAAADAQCNKAAAAAKLTGKFHAFLSGKEGGKSVRASDRIGDSAYVLVNGEPVFASKGALENGPSVAIDLDENGKRLATEVWTGTNGGGAPSSDTCNSWQSDVAADGTIGSSNSIEEWVEAGTSSCRQNFSLYCFED